MKCMFKEYLLQKHTFKNFYVRRKPETFENFSDEIVHVQKWG